MHVPFLFLLHIAKLITSTCLINLVTPYPNRSTGLLSSSIVPFLFSFLLFPSPLATRVFLELVCVIFTRGFKGLKNNFQIWIFKVIAAPYMCIKLIQTCSFIYLCMLEFIVDSYSHITWVKSALIVTFYALFISACNHQCVGHNFKPLGT